MAKPRLAELARHIPAPLKLPLKAIRNWFVSKHRAETAYWKGRYRSEKGVFRNAHYKRTMLAMAEQRNDDFCRDKIVADFGCGPRGSLVWAEQARVRIGIDVLAERYIRLFGNTLLTHNMIYVACTEKIIPLPDESVDILFTLNALDHVDCLEAMCEQLLRILKPGGLLLGSFNLEEEATPCEPQTLTESIIQRHLLKRLEVLSYRTNRFGGENLYQDFVAPSPQLTHSYVRGEKGCLWVKAIKPLARQESPTLKNDGAK